MDQRKLTIGLLCHAGCGGSTRVATQLAGGLAKRGHEVHLFSYGQPFCIAAEKDGVIFHSLGAEKRSERHPAELHTDWTEDEFNGSVARLLHTIRLHRIEVIHFHYAIPFAFMASVIKQHLWKAAPVLLGTLHGTDVTSCQCDSERRDKLAGALAYTDGLTAVSQSHAKLAAEVLNLVRTPKVIPNSVDLSRFRPAPKNTAHPPIIAHVSNFRPVKCPAQMAHIYVEIRNTIAADLWLIGDGPRMPEVKAMLNHGRFGQSVKWFGMKREVGPLLSQADLLLITSQYESFCLAALEAMACGVPVLAPEVGGLSEVVQHGETGLLFPWGDVAQATLYAQWLFTSPDEHSRMRRAARRWAERFDTERIVRLYENWYSRHLERRHDRSDGHSCVCATPG